MSRRSVKTEQEFGSDSFLDVIANIVGILIILIVIVGLKVARQPAAPENTLVVDQSLSAVDALPPDPDSLVHQQLFAGRQELAELQQEEAPLDSSVTGLLTVEETLRQEETEAESEKQAAAARLTVLRSQLNDQQVQTAEASAALRSLEQSLHGVRQELDKKQSEEQKVTQALVTAVTERDALDESLQQVVFETQQLQEVLGDLQMAKTPTDTLQHRLSPVSEKVEEGEVHFRVEHGMISHLPLEELLERLKSQVQSRRAAITRLSQYEGNVGPVKGYRMKYTVERDSMSPLESLQYGNGVYRISVSKWTIVPEETLQAEPIDEALQPGSQFRQIVETAPPGSSATFWVYPDSFDAFPKLREVAHGLQLRVAARPLPAGTPIIGSPGGSRSSAQ
jgi:hypothetical protein